MKILSINGSPRQSGSCSKIIDKIISRLNKKENEINKVNLNMINMKGCQECFYCRKNKTDRCVIRDDLSEVLEMVKTTDLLIVATPIFYADISAQLKCFIDRTWSYFGKTGVSADHLPRGRSMIFIQSYGYDNDSIYDNVYEKYRKYFKMYGFDNAYLIKAVGAQYSSDLIKNIDEVEENIKLILDGLR